jgi:hypothetical protein
LQGSRGNLIIPGTELDHRQSGVLICGTANLTKLRAQSLRYRMQRRSLTYPAKLLPGPIQFITKVFRVQHVILSSTPRSIVARCCPYHREDVLQHAVHALQRTDRFSSQLLSRRGRGPGPAVQFPLLTSIVMNANSLHSSDYPIEIA